MTISLRSTSSSTQTGITSVMYRAPATVESGDLMLWFCVNKYLDAVPGTPTGHSLVIRESGGDGVPSVDTGDVYGSWYSRVADGSESGITETVSVSGGDSVTSRSVGFYRDSGTAWDIATAFGVQSVAADTWNVTTDALDVAPGDVLVLGIAKNSDRDIAGATWTISASGVTFGSVTSLAGPIGTTNGNDVS